MVKMKKIFKNNKGSAMVLIMILIANALVILSSIVFISAIQNKATGVNALTAAAFQQADSGLEYLLREINHNLDATYDPANGDSSVDNVEDACDQFIPSTRKCEINYPEAAAYFMDVDSNVLPGGTALNEVVYIKVVGEVSNNANSVSRSLKATLFNNP